MKTAKSSFPTQPAIDDLIQSIDLDAGPATSLLQALPLITYVFRIDEIGIPVSISPQLKALLGYSPEEWVQDPYFWRSRVHPDDLARVEESLAEHNQKGIPLEGLEYRLLDADDQVHWFRDIQSLVKTENNDLFAVGVLLDITDSKRSEAELARSQQELEAILTNSPEIIARYDREFRHVFVSPSIERYTGKQPADYLGRTDREIGTPPDRTELWEAALSHVIESGEPTRMEILLEGPNGKTCHESRLVPERDSAGEIETVLAIFHDVTRLKAVEDALRESESRFRTLVENAPEAIVLLDADQGKFIDANRFAEDLFQLERDDLLQVGPVELSPPQQPDGRLSDEAAAVYIDAAIGGDTPVFEWMHVQADGQHIPCEVRLVRLPASEGNYVRGTIADISARKQAEAREREIQTKFRELFDRMPIGLYRTDAEGQILDVNQAMVKLLGYPDKKSLLARSAVDVQRHQEGRSHWIESVTQAEDHYQHDAELIRYDGSSVIVSENARAVRDESGEVLHFEGSMEDISEQRRAREEIDRLATFPTESPNPVLSIDPEGQVIYQNPATEHTLRKLGLNSTEALLPLNHGQIISESLEQHSGARVHEVEVSGRIFSWMYSPQTRFGVVHLYGQDITERKLAENQLRFEALHDPLTSLANRTLFTDRLEHAIQRAQRNDDYDFAVLFMDLNRFKVVNDSLGHLHGDELLCAVAGRLSRCVREVDTVARLGGDEFAILLEDLEDTKGATRVADRIHLEMARPFDLSGHLVYSSGSIGLAINSGEYRSTEAMLRDADTAMYQAKGRNLPTVIFDPSMHQQALKLLQLETELRTALAEHQFSLEYQPLYSLISSELLGFEALIRWEHPQRGQLPPSEFLHLAEETGIILDIGEWVMAEACHQAVDWRADRPDSAHLTMSVNMSPSQFRDAELPDRVTRVLKATGLPPECLILEITEAVLIREPNRMLAALQRFKAMGVKVHLDDFGTGYSSLSILHRFPVDALKIDRSFVERLHSDSSSEGVIRAMIDLAHSLSIDVIAEGVETEHQRQQLIELRSNGAQGFLLARPMPADEISGLLDRGPVAEIR